MAHPELEFSDTAVVIPCYNEAKSIVSVINDFKTHLPGAEIHVFDNASSDGTASLAKDAGAVVHSVLYRGKGNVVARMFADLDSEILVMADGDGTYPAAFAPHLVESIRSGADMATGVRQEMSAECYRGGHRFGNWMLTSLVNCIFHAPSGDMLSGYRAFSRRFAKAFPARSTGFEIETELTIFALEQRLCVAEHSIPYLPRQAGSSSKLNTYRDGLRILMTILYLVKEVRPFQFFSFLALGVAAISLMIGGSVLVEFLNTGLVPRFPSAILASALAILASILFCIGIVLDSVSSLRRQGIRQTLVAMPQRRARANVRSGQPSTSVQDISSRRAANE